MLGRAGKRFDVESRENMRIIDMRCGGGGGSGEDRYGE